MWKSYFLFSYNSISIFLYISLFIFIHTLIFIMFIIRSCLKKEKEKTKIRIALGVFPFDFLKSSFKISHFQESSLERRRTGEEQKLARENENIA